MTRTLKLGELGGAKPARRDAQRRLAFLMCPPDHFAVQYVINPWMEGNVGRTNPRLARRQWEALRDHVAALADVELMQPAEGLPDLVFTANAGLVLERRVLLSHFRHPERRREEARYKAWFEQQGFEVVELPRGIYFEGAGDALFDRAAARLWLGYGVRTVLDACDYVANELALEVVPLRLVDRRFYHLDTCLAPLSDGTLLYYPAAFDEHSRRRIEELTPADRRLAVSEADAMHFACNCLEIERRVILNDCTDELAERLRSRGFEVIRASLGEFMLAGGAARCLCLRLTEAPPRQAGAGKSGFARRIVTMEGHLLDSGRLAGLMDLIVNTGGNFAIEELRAGQRHEDASFIRLAVGAPTPEALDRLLAQLLQNGARLEDAQAESAQLAEIELDGVAPENFYSTTIYPTDVLVGGRWLRAERQRMDGVIVVEGEGGETRATVRLLRDLKRGQRIVVGVEGLRIHAQPTGRGNGHGEFRFMSSEASSERRVEIAVQSIAWDMKRIRQRNGRIVLVAGPVAVHTGGIPYLCELARRGYIQALLAGNALAVHDLELVLYGTSLGVDLKRGVTIHGGHRHHLMAINTIRRCGGIAEAVRQGVLPHGLMYELVTHDIPFCLAGSIRDDGPLPETQMDLVKAHEEYARLLEGADMILMLSSMLHSIGVGNMTPSGVKLVCVDINPAVATKLADRGSFESVPVITDVGLFLSALTRKLEE